MKWMLESVFAPHFGQLGSSVSFMRARWSLVGRWPVIVLTVWDKRGFLMFFRCVEIFPLIRLTTDLVFVPCFE